MKICVLFTEASVQISRSLDLLAFRSLLFMLVYSCTHLSPHCYPSWLVMQVYLYSPVKFKFYTFQNLPLTSKHKSRLTQLLTDTAYYCIFCFSSLSHIRTLVICWVTQWIQCSWEFNHHIYLVKSTGWTRWTGDLSVSHPASLVVQQLGQVVHIQRL